MRIPVVLAGLVLLAFTARADEAPFDNDHWIFQNAQVREHLGRTALTGTALLKDVVFENGVIEVDIAASGARSYPGLVFRMQSPTDYERFYIRPHCANGFFYNALQYTPVINNVAGWQLYSGEGFTGPLKMPLDEWVHLKMEIQGSQARVYVGDGEAPVLTIPRLQHGVSRGSIGLMGENNGTAFFSDFSYNADDGLVFDPVDEETPPLGTIVDWELSRTFKGSEIDVERFPDGDLGWTKIRSAPSGLVDILRHRTWQPGVSDRIYARTFIEADAAGPRKFWVGYSDQVHLYLNGRLLFFGDSAYRSRDPGFAGIVGLKDAVYLPLEKGQNELRLLLAEGFGGWGFICRDGEALQMDDRLSKAWERRTGFDYPESVCYDAKQDLLYVSNFFNNGDEYISKVKPDGEIVNRYWVKGLDRPTGLCLTAAGLYAVERTRLARIDPGKGEIVERYPFIRPAFPNDVAADPQGRLYISDSQKNCIYRFEDGGFETWIKDLGIVGPNGLGVDGTRLLVGCSGDGTLKSVDLETREVSTLAAVGAGSIMDGVQPDGRGNVFFSDYNGRLFSIRSDGEVLKWMDTTALEIPLADLVCIPEKNLLVIPSLAGNRVMAYRYAR